MMNEGNEGFAFEYSSLGRPRHTETKEQREERRAGEDQAQTLHTLTFQAARREEARRRAVQMDREATARRERRGW